MRVGYPDTMNRKEASPLKANYLQSGASEGDLPVVSMGGGSEEGGEEQPNQPNPAKEARQQRRADRIASGDKTAAGKQIQKVGKGIAKVGKGIGKGISKLFGV